MDSNQIINDNLDQKLEENLENYENESNYSNYSNYSYDSESKDLIYKSSLKETITLTENIKISKTKQKSNKKKKNISLFNDINNRKFNPRLPPYLLVKKINNNNNVENNDINFPKL